MNIAIISDIHANLPALRAAFRDMEAHQPDAIYCLGDLVNFAGWDKEVIDLIRQRNIPCVQGNHDEGIGHGKKDFPFSFKGDAQYAFGLASIEKVNARLSEPYRSYLRSLPFSITLTFHVPFQPVKVVLTHGSPVSNNDYIQPEASDAALLELLDIADADILVLGYTHRPFHRSLLSERNNQPVYRHVVNVGSVGKSKDGPPDAVYTLLHFGEVKRLEDPDAVQVEFRHVPYDTNEVIQHLKGLGMSNAYDEYLTTGQ